MFGRFRDKVINVNNKIHGIYDKIGAAKIEAEWYGGLVMQYKNIYIPVFLNAGELEAIIMKCVKVLKEALILILLVFLLMNLKMILKR